ncbi:copper resistance CopC/CopD family protein [Blastococcus sp. PRF04-17]|uniref:copper resistance CopC/CopD family protein n=1 Tax=Blastococcus sp. PRF04-17 TaxID=2933797 RepID=UPI001FF1FC57|nr:copper resistance CopC family protein [Blastococcus sp. PRF04-17]UOY03643.1 copper resistance protein CopC [Blastococcus sp. PRF04-17]
MTRSAALLVPLIAGWLLLGLLTAGPAAAHATLVATDPAEGARMDEAPDEITLTFSEPVSLGAGYARLIHSDGTVHLTETSVDGGTVTVVPRSELPDDQGYLLTYRVVSADSHPISGAFSFTVGDADLVAAGTAVDPTDPLVATALPIARWVGFAGLALAIGVPVLVLVCWPAGWAADRLRRLAVGGALAVAVAAAVSFLLQGPYAAATGLGSIADTSLLAATASSAAGWVLLARLGLALALAALLRTAWRGDAPTLPAVVAGGLLAAGLVVSTAAIGHPVAGPWPGLAVAVTVVHVAAMAVWLGGLAGLLAGVLRPGTPADDLATAVPRYSRLAFASVSALVVSGVVQSVREVESPTGLFFTTYGWVLVAKLVLVLVVLAAAGVSRVWVQQRLGVRRSRPGPRRSLPAHAFANAGGGPPAQDGPAAVREHLQSESAAEHVPALRRSVLVEVVVAAAILALSAVLVGTPPARSAVAEPVDVVLPLEGRAGPSGSVQISLDPARPGPNTLHVYLFDDTGRLTQPADLDVSLTEQAQEIGPLDVDLQPAGPGHYVGDGTAIPGAGTWTLSVSVRLDEFTATTASTTFPVR